jgi:branched-chain amino acid transport system permease protein
MLIYLLMAVVLFVRPEGLLPARRADMSSATLDGRGHQRRAAAPASGGAGAAAGHPVPAAGAGAARRLTRHAGRWLGLLTRALIFAIAALSLDLILGSAASSPSAMPPSSGSAPMSPAS